MTQKPAPLRPALTATVAALALFAPPLAAQQLAPDSTLSAPAPTLPDAASVEAAAQTADQAPPAAAVNPAPTAVPAPPAPATPDMGSGATAVALPALPGAKAPAARKAPTLQPRMAQAAPTKPETVAALTPTATDTPLETVQRPAATAAAPTMATGTSRVGPESLESRAVADTDWVLPLALGTGAVILLIGGGYVMFAGRRTQPVRRTATPAIDLGQAQPATPSVTAPPVSAGTALPVMAQAPAQRYESPIAQQAGATYENALVAAQVEEAPSSENPFLTRRNRLRRARFNIRHGIVPATQPQEVQVMPEAAPVAAAVRTTPAPRPQPVATVRPRWQFPAFARMRFLPS